MPIRFLQDCLLVDNKILVVGDLHLGHEEAIPGFQVREIIEKLEEVFRLLEREGININKIVLLGDIKHDFVNISDEEWRDGLKFFDYLIERLESNTVNLTQVKKDHASKSISEIISFRDLTDTKNSKVFFSQKKTERIVVLKGNHDIKLNPILRKRGIGLRDKYIYRDICFLHGSETNKFNLVFEQLFKQCLDSKILIVGHIHPAITLSDSYKKEKYKCFLRGMWKKKQVIILPSFNDVGIGFDLRRSENNILKNFEVIIYDPKSNKELNFGKLKKLY